ncbi:MAG: tetratricopeptide repeat protein [Alphaproteobacteria bacterium]
MLTVILLGAVSCTGGPIAESGSRADRVFVMAEEGDSTAQTALGLLYERGLGVPRDAALALVWYRRAAAQGDALAEFHIGSLYERGVGVARDYTEAAVWYRRASDRGNASAQAALAYLYDRGLGVARDFAEAEALYSQASASWAEFDSYPVEATFATGREGPALASPSVGAVPIGERRPEFSAGQDEAPAIEIDLAALDDVPEPDPAATVFDGPEPIAGRGENFPLAARSLAPPEQTRVPDADEPPGNVPLGAVDMGNSLPPLPPRPKPPARLPPDENMPAVHLQSPDGEEMAATMDSTEELLVETDVAQAVEEAEEGLLIAAQPESERTVVSVKQLLEEEGAAGEAAESPLRESEASVNGEDNSASGGEAAESALASAQKNLIASLDAELDQEAAEFAAVLDAATEEDILLPLPPEPEIFLISLATFETEALAVAAWQEMSATHAGLLRRLPYELQPIDMGEDGQFFELIVGPLDTPVQSRSLCGALRAHGHVCRTIDR